MSCLCIASCQKSWSSVSCTSGRADVTEESVPTASSALRSTEDSEQLFPKKLWLLHITHLDIYQLHLQLLSGLLTRKSSLSGWSHLRSDCVKKEDSWPFEPFWCLLMDLWGSNVIKRHVWPAYITNVSGLLAFSCQTLGVVPKLSSEGTVRNFIL